MTDELTPDDQLLLDRLMEAAKTAAITCRQRGLTFAQAMDSLHLAVGAYPSWSNPHSKAAALLAGEAELMDAYGPDEVLAYVLALGDRN